MNTRPPGRPRSVAIDEAISASCRSLLIDVGFAGLTIEAVAERAGVGRPTIYRRWPSKAHMVWDLVFTTPADAQVIGDTDDLEADVLLWIEATTGFFLLPEVARAFPALLVENLPERDVLESLRDPVREQVMARLRRGIEEGVLRPDCDPSAIFELVTGFAIFRSVVPQGSGVGPSPGVVAAQILSGCLLRKE